MDLSVVDEETAEQLYDAGDFEIKKCRTDPNLNFSPQKFSEVADKCDEIYLDFKADEADKLLKIRNLPVDDVYTYYIMRNRKRVENYEDNSNSYYLITLHVDFASVTVDPHIYYYDFTATGNFNVVKSGVLTKNGLVDEVEAGDSFLYNALSRRISMNTALVRRPLSMRINTGVDCAATANNSGCSQEQMYVTVWKSDPSGSLANYKSVACAGIRLELGSTSSEQNLCYNPGKKNGESVVNDFASSLCKTQGIGAGKKMHAAQFDELPVGWYVVQWNKRLCLVHLSNNFGRIINGKFDGKRYIWQCAQKSAQDFELDESCGIPSSNSHDGVVEFSLNF
ncbi:MAG: hypothetical protein LBP35_00020 [Candidatus Ancillula trichonymphae]|jgi:hypothetical protein|nr:hypothetical protein [Candidatus Ancillula trichonymphae]